jgi:hypothetical protein
VNSCQFIIFLKNNLFIIISRWVIVRCSTPGDATTSPTRGPGGAQWFGPKTSRTTRYSGAIESSSWYNRSFY